MAVKIQLRRGTAAQWTAANPILYEGEFGFETDTRRYKIGNGVHAWNDNVNLPYYATGTLTGITTAAGSGLSGGGLSGTLTLAVDPSVVITNAYVDGRGDLITATTNNTPALLSLGTDGQVLIADTANGANTKGIKWGQITAAGITDDTITAAKIAPNAITSSELADGSVDTAAIVDLNVTTAKLANDAVTNVKIATGAVGSDEIATGAVGTEELADSVVTTAKINNLAVTGAKIANSTISAGKLDTKYVQQGTGVGQLANTVKVGWNGYAICLDVDATNFGPTWPMNITGQAATVAGQTTAATANSVAVRGSNGSINASSISCGGLTYASSGAGYFGNTTTNGDGVVRAGAYDNNATAITTNQVTGNYHMAFYYNGSNIGSVYGTASNVSFNTSSDYRLKENVVTLNNALSTIEMLQPKAYNFITSPDVVQHGFIAHELEEVVPYAVTGEKDAVDEKGNIKPQQVDYSKLVAVLVGAIQELSARVKELENK